MQDARPSLLVDSRRVWSLHSLAPCTSHSSKVCCCFQILAMQNSEISLILAFTEVSVRQRECQESRWGRRRCALGMLTMLYATENGELCSFADVCYLPASLPGWFLLEELHSSGLGSRGT